MYVQKATQVTAGTVEQIITAVALKNRDVNHYRESLEYYVGRGMVFYSILTMYWPANDREFLITNINDMGVSSAARIKVPIISLADYEYYFNNNLLPL